MIQTSSRVSEWLQQRINYASSNLETLLIVQKQLLNYKELFAFLHAHTPNLANNITASYVHTASTHYFNFYKARFDEFSRLLVRSDIPCSFSNKLTQMLLSSLKPRTSMT